ncbi:hypothetical protein [Streptomyces albofaciens]|uniref:hypothetical protein n=1 Tax=Streptomyces albofaciens TaxID=66866 RepID=UPI001FCB82BD|nr:hypothetical protein [Streptomyces albofaciens]
MPSERECRFSGVEQVWRRCGAGVAQRFALLIGEPAFPDPEHVKAAVPAGSLIAAVLAALLIKRRNGIHRRLYEAGNRDQDADGTPGIHQQAGAGPAPRSGRLS